MPGTIPHSCAPHEPLSFSCAATSAAFIDAAASRAIANGNARSSSCHQRCPAAAVQQMPTRATSHSDTSNWLSPPQPLLPDRQPHCSAFSSAAVRGDTATARACSSRSGEDGSTGGRHAARRQGQQERLCFARACARLVPVERGAGRPAGRSGQGGWVVICPTASDRATALRCRLCAAMSTGGISLRRSTSLWLVALSRADHWGIYKYKNK